MVREEECQRRGFDDEADDSEIISAEASLGSDSRLKFTGFSIAFVISNLIPCFHGMKLKNLEALRRIIIKMVPFMKGIANTATLGLILVSSAFGQGEVNFANAAAGVNSPVTDVNGALLSAGLRRQPVLWNHHRQQNLTLSQLTDADLGRAISHRRRGGVLHGESQDIRPCRVGQY